MPKSVIAAAVLLSAAWTGAAAAAAPGNDKIGNAYLLADSQRSVFGTLVDATADPAPAIMGSVGRPSVWYKIDTPAAGTYYVDTAGSFSGRSTPIELLLAVFRKGAGGTLGLVRQGGGITIDGALSKEVSGFRFEVAEDTPAVYIAVAAPNADGRRDFRLNIHRFAHQSPNPIVVTPPMTFVSGGAFSFFSGGFTEEPVYAIFNALTPSQQKARIRFGHDFESGVGFETVANTVVNDNQAIVMRPKATGSGPHAGETGTFDHLFRIEARNPVNNVLWANRAVATKFTRYAGYLATGRLEVTASVGSRVGTLGERVVFDVKVKNLLGDDARGCYLTSRTPTPVAAGGVYVGERFTYAAVDPATGQPSTHTNPTFDLKLATTRTFRVTSEIRSRESGGLAVRVVCATPTGSTSTGSAGMGLHPLLYGENLPLLLPYAVDRPDAEVTFPETGAQASASPRHYVVPVLGEKRFPVVVANTGAQARLLAITAGGWIPGLGTLPTAVDAKVCFDGPAAGDDCAAAPSSYVAATFAPGQSRRVVVVLSGKGVPVAYKPAQNRLFVNVSHNLVPVGFGGFAVSTSN
jgi:hypothetical protein